MSHIVLAEGSVFADRYRIIRRIAHGGMGAVYEVVHIETNKRRALKVMLANMLTTKGMHERFQQEARVTSGIESEFIVEVMDAGIDAATQTPFLVMELLRGEDLSRKLARGVRFSADEVLTILKQVAIALDKTHKASIVHRDLKPENLFLTERDDGSPRIKILDFGVAKIVADSTTNAHATQSLGTPLYMAPEQFQQRGAVTGATDIFALGLIAYTLLVGVPYWQDEIDAGTNAYVFVGIALHGLPEPPSVRAGRRGVTLPAGFDAWCAKATAMAPGDRFASASDAIRALSDVCGAPFGISGELSQSARLPSLAPVPLSALLPSSGSALSTSDPIILSTDPGEPLPLGLTGSAPLHQTANGPAAISKSGNPLSGKSVPVTLRGATDAGISATSVKPLISKTQWSWAIATSLCALLGVGGWAVLATEKPRSTDEHQAVLEVQPNAHQDTPTAASPAPSAAPVPEPSAESDAGGVITIDLEDEDAGTDGGQAAPGSSEPARPTAPSASSSMNSAPSPPPSPSRITPPKPPTPPVPQPKPNPSGRF